MKTDREMPILQPDCRAGVVECGVWSGCWSPLQGLLARHGKYSWGIKSASTEHSNGRDLKIGSSNLHQESLPVGFAVCRKTKSCGLVAFQLAQPRVPRAQAVHWMAQATDLSPQERV